MELTLKLKLVAFSWSAVFILLSCSFMCQVNATPSIISRKPGAGVEVEQERGSDDNLVSSGSGGSADHSIGRDPDPKDKPYTTENTVTIEDFNKGLDAFIRKLGLLDYEVLGGERIWEPRFMDHVGHENALHYTNEWVVHIPQTKGKQVNGSDSEFKAESDPNIIANETGYINYGRVEGFPDTYRFVKIDHPKSHKRSARDLTAQLSGHNQVNWADQQYAKFRTKRFIDLMGMLGLDKLNFQMPSFMQASPTSTKSPGSQNQKAPQGHDIVTRFNDPLWDKEWYLIDKRTKTERSLAPRLDMNVLPVFRMGFTGKGSSVCVLDDGLEHTHSDIADTYDPRISGDLNDDDRDPTPVYNTKPPNSHGTRCAGEIAMKPNNSICGVGIAYNCRIGGVRMLDGPVSDRIEGQALIYALPGVDIYSASWGPSDDGQTVEGPGRMAQAAFLKGIQQGRGGKGVIYVWASGNGGANGDSCSCDGYASNIYTLSVGSASQKGAFPWYGELCPSTMAVTYSSGAYSDQKIATTDIKNSCTTGHTGTSASAPIAAGIVALTLEANPNLTWRDVQHLTAWTSEPGPVADNPGWYSNAAGFHVSPHFGFGLMDAHAMVISASTWTNVPTQRICRVHLNSLADGRLNGATVKKAVFQATGCRGTANEINFLEHIEVLTDVQYNDRGALQIDLTSPQGTTTRLLFARKKDVSAVGFTNWPFMSVHTWGENPAGSWIITFSDAKRDPTNRGSINKLVLVLYGTTEEPEYRKGGPRVYPQQDFASRKKSLLKNRRNNLEDGSNPQLENLQAILNDIHAEDFI